MRKFDWPITSKKKTFREAPQNRRLYFEIQSSSPFGTPICLELGNSLLWHPHPYFQILKKKKLPRKFHCPSGKWTVGSPHSSPNTTWKKNPRPGPPTRKKQKGRPLHTIMQVLIGCMEILFLKLAANYFWPGLNLIALPKNTQPIQ
jgi:hypothetical protein